eukprot:m.83400 g.83400  ORF g.83400 m.83400 type:complete len:154 (+) comp25630_c0_seq2:377-838(+)
MRYVCAGMKCVALRPTPLASVSNFSKVVCDSQQSNDVILLADLRDLVLGEIGDSRAATVPEDVDLTVLVDWLVLTETVEFTLDVDSLVFKDFVNVATCATSLGILKVDPLPCGAQAQEASCRCLSWYARKHGQSIPAWPGLRKCNGFMHLKQQ